jgi:hypothetical protein
MNAIALITSGYIQNLISRNFLAVRLNRPEFRFLDLLFPWIAAIGLSGFLVAWLVVLSCKLFENVNSLFANESEFVITGMHFDASASLMCVFWNFCPPDLGLERPRSHYFTAS